MSLDERLLETLKMINTNLFAINKSLESVSKNIDMFNNCVRMDTHNDYYLKVKG